MSNTTLAQKLGERRAEGYEEFLAELERLPCSTEVERDRLVFTRLFGAALVEGLNERTDDRVDPERIYNAFTSASFVFGHLIAAYAVDCFEANAREASIRAFVDACVQHFGAAVQGVLQKREVEISPHD